MNEMIKLLEQNTNIGAKLHKVSHEYIDADILSQLLPSEDERAHYAKRKIALEAERVMLIALIRELNAKLDAWK